MLYLNKRIFGEHEYNWIVCVCVFYFIILLFYYFLGFTLRSIKFHEEFQKMKPPLSYFAMPYINYKKLKIPLVGWVAYHGEKMKNK